jgi:hypothetical protein
MFCSKSHECVASAKEAKQTESSYAFKLQQPQECLSEYVIGGIGPNEVQEYDVSEYVDKKELYANIDKIQTSSTRFEFNFLFT